MSETTAHNRRKARIRAKLARINSGKPRLTVHRTNAHIYAQIIDDSKQVTLAFASSIDKGYDRAKLSGSNKAAATLVGKMIADRAKKVGITSVVFDRSGYKYHGRIKSLADAARENGLVF